MSPGQNELIRSSLQYKSHQISKLKWLLSRLAATFGQSMNPWKPGVKLERRCSWSSADRRCSNHIWVVNNFIAFSGAPYIRGLTVCRGCASEMTNVDKYISLIFKPHFNKVFTTRDDTLRFRTQYSNITNIRLFCLWSSAHQSVAEQPTCVASCDQLMATRYWWDHCKSTGLVSEWQLSTVKSPPASCGAAHV